MKNIKLHKNIEHFDYYAMVEDYVIRHHKEKMIAVLFDLAYHFQQIDIEEAEKQVDRLGLTDLGLDQVIESDCVIIHFDKMTEMEEYMYRTEFEGIWIKYYKFGELFEEFESDI
jgi:hypothetical protein